MLTINGIPLEDTFAEAFPMTAARLVVTAETAAWARTAGQVATGGKGVLDAIDRFVPPACDTAALRVLGLSFAGWNVLASLALAVVAFRGAFARG